jgi:hypothetical protein
MPHVYESPPSAYTIRYLIADYDEREPTECTTTWNPTAHPRYALEDAAQDHFECHDGWESRWPLTFSLVDENGAEYARAVMRREDRPEFFADMLTPEPEGEPNL